MSIINRKLYWPSSEVRLILAGASLLSALLILNSQIDVWGLNLLQALLGIPYAMLAPGYLLQLSLFPKQADLGWDGRLALSFGLSIAVVAPMALILDQFEGGLLLVPFATAWLGLIFLLTVAAGLRQLRVPPAERVRLGWSFSPRAVWAGQSRSGRWLMFLLGTSLLLGIAAGVGLALLPLPSAQFTEFYILVEGGMAEDYPYTLVVNQPAQIIVGIKNHENRSMLYILESRDPSGIIGRAGPFVLEHEEITEFQFTFYPGSVGENTEINFYLFRFGITEPYRTTRLIADVRETIESP